MPRGYLYAGGSDPYSGIAGQELNRDQARDSRYFNSLAAQRALEEMQFRQQQAMAAQRMQQMEMAQRIRENRLQTMLGQRRHQENRGDALQQLLMEKKRYEDQLGLRREQFSADTADLTRQREDEALFSEGGADSANAQLDLARQGHREDLLSQITDLEEGVNTANKGTRWWLPDKGNPESRSRAAALQMQKLTGGKPLFDVQLPSAKLGELLTAILKGRDDLRYDDASGKFVPALRRASAQAKQPDITKISQSDIGTTRTRIRDLYRSGAMTREEAKRRLLALGGG